MARPLPLRPPGSRPRAEPTTIVATIAFMIAGLLPLVFVQPALARTTHKMKETRDTSVLPPPEQLRALTLGYHDAGVDLLWTKLLVEYGTHWEEKRAFPAAALYLDAIIGLDPKYVPVYKFADTILFYHPGGTPTEADAELSSKYMERGIAELPDNGNLALHYGQFLAFIEVSVVPPERIEALRAKGARAMMRGVEHGADSTRILSAASLLDATGARDAALDGLERTYALTDDPATRKQIAERIKRLQGSAVRDEAERQIKAVEARWGTDFDFLTRGEYLLVAPMPDPAACAGTSRAGSPSCAYDWPTALAEPAVESELSSVK